MRDSGLQHCLLKLEGLSALESHPRLGASWEGFALEQALNVTGDRDAYFWSTDSGPELDLLVFWRGKRVGLEFKYRDAPDLTKSVRVALEELKLDQLFVVYPGGQSFKMADKVELLSIQRLPERLGNWGT